MYNENILKLAEKLLECVKDLPAEANSEPKDTRDKIDCVEDLIEKLQDSIDEYKTSVGTDYARQELKEDGNPTHFQDPEDLPNQFDYICELYDMDSLEVLADLTIQDYE